MKHLLLTTIAAVVLVGCGESQQSALAPEAKQIESVVEAAKPTAPPKVVSANKGADPARGVKAEPPTAKTPDISIHEAAEKGNIEAVKQHLAEGGDVNAKEDQLGMTPLSVAAAFGHTEIAELLIAKGADVDGWSWEKAQRIRCVHNLNKIGIATRIYATDNQDRFPWQVPQSEGGTAEIAQPRSDTDALLDSDGKPIFDANAWQHFLALSNELSNPKVLRCPNDESRTQANTFQSTTPKGAGRNIIPFEKNSVSYWLRTDPEVNEARPNEVMVVCPHHDGYNILFTDSSTLRTDWNRLVRYFKDITNPITIAPQ